MDAIQQFFKEEQQKLNSFVFRMTNHIEDTHDIVQDTLVTAIEKFDQFKGESSLKTWIFSIASRKTIDHLRKEKRWAENVMDKAKSAAMAEPEIIGILQNVVHQSPQGTFEVTEHMELCFRCLSKTLPIEQQVSLMLKDIFDFKVKEIAEIIERTVSQVKHYLEDARAKMIEIYDRRCALINKNGVCNQCSELCGIFNPKQDAQARLMEVKFVKDAQNKSKEALFQLRTDLVKSIDPLQAEGHEFQHRHMKFICEVAERD